MQPNKFIHLIILISLILISIVLIGMSDTGVTNSYMQAIRETKYGDKLVHFFLFGFLCFFANLSLNYKSIRIYKRSKVYVGTLVIGTLVLLEEYSQSFIKTRTFDWEDILADFCAFMFFSLLTYLFESINKRSRQLKRHC